MSRKTAAQRRRSPSKWRYLDRFGWLRVHGWTLFDAGPVPDIRRSRYSWRLVVRAGRSPIEDSAFAHVSSTSDPGEVSTRTEGLLPQSMRRRTS
jgi:hypothetical protein